jgi:hypothetical protein
MRLCRQLALALSEAGVYRGTNSPDLGLTRNPPRALRTPAGQVDECIGSWRQLRFHALGLSLRELSEGTPHLRIDRPCKPEPHYLIIIVKE